MSKNEEEATYEAPVVTERVIKSNEARLVMGNLKKAKEAKAAVPAVKEVKDKDGNIITPAVAAVAATPASPAVQTVYLLAIDADVCDEVNARMAAQGFEMSDTDAPVECEYGSGKKGWKLTYTAADDKGIRAAFKKVKGKDDFNKPGLAKLKEAAKLEAKAKAAVEKAEGKEAAPEKKGGKKKDAVAKTSVGGGVVAGAFDEGAVE